MPSIKIVTGDALTVLRRIKDNSVSCVMTSPPYFGLRNYGTPGQIGLEQSPSEYVAKLVEIFREVRRVLRPDGTCWLNLGDSYAGSGKGGNPGHSKYQKQKTNFGSLSVRDVRRDDPLLEAKQLFGIPWRVAFALQADGWYLRQDIIWHKPNPMPESVRDRCTKAHEYLFVLTKSAKYYYDADAIRDPFETADRKGERRSYKPGSSSSYRIAGGHETQQGSFAGLPLNPNGRNKRSVWTIAPKPFKEAHFATFPPDLVEPCILAGCPENGIVLDPFGGSGTTALVARNLNRNAVLIELNPEYVEIAKRRLGLDK